MTTLPTASQTPPAPALNAFEKFQADFSAAQQEFNDSAIAVTDAEDVLDKARQRHRDAKSRLGKFGTAAKKLVPAATPATATAPTAPTPAE